MPRANPSDPRQSLRTAVHGLRALGTALLLGWAFFAVIGVSARLVRLRISDLFILAPALIILLAPAILYHIAAIFIQRRELWAATLALRTAVCQCLIFAVAIILLICTNSTGAPILRTMGPMIFVPTIIAMFFAPALIAQMYALVKAIRAVRLLPQTRQGFEPILSPPSLEPTPTSQVIDSDCVEE